MRARLKRCLRRTRDAPARWEAFLAKELEAMGFARGLASPRCYRHQKRDLVCVVHGDDFFVVARGAGRQYFEKIIRAAYEVKISISGPSAEDEKELRVLGRVLTFLPDCVTLEAGPRLHESVIQQLGLSEAKAVGTPGCYTRGDSPSVNLHERRVRAEPIDEGESDGDDTSLDGPGSRSMRRWPPD